MSRPVFAAVVFMMTMLTTADLNASPSDKWTGTDKWMHGALSASIAQMAFLTAHALEPESSNEWMPLTVAFGGTLALGLSKEGYDALSGGHFSGKDLVWDVGGTLVGTGLAWLLTFLLGQ